MPGCVFEVPFVTAESKDALGKSGIDISKFEGCTGVLVIPRSATRSLADNFDDSAISERALGKDPWHRYNGVRPPKSWKCAIHTTSMSKFEASISSPIYTDGPQNPRQGILILSDCDVRVYCAEACRIVP